MCVRYNNKIYVCNKFDESRSYSHNPDFNAKDIITSIIENPDLVINIEDYYPEDYIPENN
jgi:hypothetical protein